MAKVLLKKSSVSSNAPGTGDLDYGEIAINYADGRLYYKNSSNQIKNFVDSDILLANYLRSLWDDKSPEIGGNLEIDSFTITNSTYGPGSYIALQRYYTGDSAQQAVFSSRQDVNIIIDANNGSPNGRFIVRANDSDINTASIVFSVNELGNVDITGTLDMNLKQINRVAAPTLGTDAVNKEYVDNAVSQGVGGLNFPTGDWGLVDSDLSLDAFGIAITGDFYDTLTEPANSLGQVDLGTDSAI